MKQGMPSDIELAAKVINLSVSLVSGPSSAQLVDHVSLDIAKGQTYGIVGESGSGKSLTAQAMMRLLAADMDVTGSVIVDGTDLQAISEKQMRRRRGADIAMIFQDPFAALNPVFTIGSQVAAAVHAHTGRSRRDGDRMARELLRDVGLDDPELYLRKYPHQLSGGQAQRVAIAIALAGEPKILIADEPTTALDVTIQDGILSLLERLVLERQVAVVLISHDLAVVARLSTRIAVMYAGQVVEDGATDQIINDPRHPYTRALVRCVPDFRETNTKLRGIPGSPPLPSEWPAGCRFADRCVFAVAGCETPKQLQDAPGGFVRCDRDTPTLFAQADADRELANQEIR